MLFGFFLLTFLPPLSSMEAWGEKGAEGVRSKSKGRAGLKSKDRNEGLTLPHIKTPSPPSTPLPSSTRRPHRFTGTSMVVYPPTEAVSSSDASREDTTKGSQNIEAELLRYRQIEDRLDAEFKRNVGPSERGKSSGSSRYLDSIAGMAKPRLSSYTPRLPPPISSCSDSIKHEDVIRRLREKHNRQKPNDGDARGTSSRRRTEKADDGRPSYMGTTERQKIRESSVPKGLRPEERIARFSKPLPHSDEQSRVAFNAQVVSMLRHPTPPTSGHLTPRRGSLTQRGERRK